MQVFLFAVLVFLATHWTQLVSYLPANAQSAIGLALVLGALFGGSLSNN